jgi:hypothetical protein
MKRSLILILLLCTFVVIAYLYFGKTTEYFSSPSQTSLTQQSGGTSKLYNWPTLSKLNTYVRKCPSSEETTTTVENCSVQPEATSSTTPTCCPTQETIGGCSSCDITRHPDIDKYVLKSSVPPCPDLRNYALKSSLSPDVDMSNYILKSDMEACPPRLDISDYIHKNSIPACPQCPVIPKCPISTCSSCYPGSSEVEEESFNRTVTETSELSEEGDRSTVMETALSSNGSGTSSMAESNSVAYRSFCGSEMEACNLGNGVYANYGVKPIATIPVDGLNVRTNYNTQKI